MKREHNITSEAGWVWVACAIDGEGSIGLFDKRDGTGRINIQIGCYNNNRAFLERLFSICQAGKISEVSSK